MKTKIINLIISAGWHEGELSVADNIDCLYADEINAFKRKLREAEDLIQKLSKNVPVIKPTKEPKVEAPKADDFLKLFSVTTQKEMFYNNVLARNWAIGAMEGFVMNFYDIKKIEK